MCSTSIIGGWGGIGAPEGRSGVRKKSLKESEAGRRRKNRSECDSVSVIWLSKLAIERQ